jgi:hypothetical protein
MRILGSAKAHLFTHAIDAHYKWLPTFLTNASRASDINYYKPSVAVHAHAFNHATGIQEFGMCCTQAVWRGSLQTGRTGATNMLYEHCNNTAVIQWSLPWRSIALTLHRKPTFRGLSHSTIRAIRRDDRRMGCRKLNNKKHQNVYPSHNNKLIFHHLARLLSLLRLCSGETQEHHVNDRWLQSDLEQNTANKFWHKISKLSGGKSGKSQKILVRILSLWADIIPKTTEQEAEGPARRSRFSVI